MMATICAFPLGQTAVFEAGSWACDDTALQEALTLLTQGLVAGHYPWPAHDIAEEVAGRLGGAVIAADPPPASPDDVEF